MKKFILKLLPTGKNKYPDGWIRPTSKKNYGESRFPELNGTTKEDRSGFIDTSGITPKDSGQIENEE